MPDAKQILIFYEGDDDKALLQKLRAAKVLPGNWQLAERSKEHHPGKDGLVRQLLAFVRPVSGVGGSAVVLVDLDELTFEERFAWFHNQLRQELQGSEPAVAVEPGPVLNGRVHLIRLVADGKQGRVALIPVGLPGDPDLTENYKIDRFAIDDWILRLIRNERVFAAVTDVATVPYHIAMTKFIEVAELFRKNGLEVRKSKSYVQILRALAAIAPATATIVGRFVQKGIETLSDAEFRALMHPLLEDLETSLQLLAGD